jgi:hypothetical protein
MKTKHNKQNGTGTNAKELIINVKHEKGEQIS